MHLPNLGDCIASVAASGTSQPNGRQQARSAVEGEADLSQIQEAIRKSLGANSLIREVPLVATARLIGNLEGTRQEIVWRATIYHAASTRRCWAASGRGKGARDIAGELYVHAPRSHAFVETAACCQALDRFVYRVVETGGVVAHVGIVPDDVAEPLFGSPQSTLGARQVIVGRWPGRRHAQPILATGGGDVIHELAGGAGHRLVLTYT